MEFLTYEKIYQWDTNKVFEVRDDGSCEVNGFCKCAEGGIATKSERGYRVVERVNDSVIKVLFYLTGETF